MTQLSKMNKNTGRTNRVMLITSLFDILQKYKSCRFSFGLSNRSRFIKTGCIQKAQRCGSLFFIFLMEHYQENKQLQYTEYFGRKTVDSSKSNCLTPSVEILLLLGYPYCEQ